MAFDNSVDSHNCTDSTTRHKLARKAFDELAAGGGGPNTVACLRAGELSRRLILFRALHDLLHDQPALLGPLPPFMDAWQVLERAQEAAPSTVNEILLSSSVGAWLSFAFREHARRRESTEVAGTFGQLHLVALVCAAAAGQRFASRIPLRNGCAYLPLRGLAYFDTTEPLAIADVRTEDGRITIEFGGHRVAISADGAATNGWWPLRRISTRTGPAGAMNVWLDDLDPMRDLADPVPPSRLTDDEVQGWQQLLDAAWVILTSHHPDVAESIVGGVTTLVPLPVGPSGETRSASSGDAFGAIMCSPPPDPTTLAVSLVHEFAHIRLGGLMHLLQLTEGGADPVLYAPWRDDPRPLGGLMQGVYAFFSIADFWRRQRHAVEAADAALAEFEYAYARAQATDGLATVQESGRLTPHGIAFTERLADELRLWTQDPVDSSIAGLAQLVSDSHRAGWRIRHCRPTEDDMTRLVGLWGPTEPSGSIHLGPSIVEPDSTMKQWSHGRLGLARRSVLPPDQRLVAPNASWAAGLTEADFALFNGDSLTASKGFADQIVESPDRLDAWTGLALALGMEGRRSAAAAVLRRPEFALRAFQAINATAPRQVSPIEFATWFSHVTA